MVKEAASQPAAPPDAGQESGLVPLGSHQPVLDGLRGLAILLVLFHHFTVVNSTSGVDWILLRLSGTAWCGVDLFFVLSGFLIGGILLDSRGRPGYFRTFYARRTLRIFPLYYAVVALALVVLPAVAAWIRSPAIAEKLDRLSHLDGSQVWYWTYLSNYAIAWAGNFQNPILGVSWSLAIEEQFYLVWPAVVYFLSRQRLLYACVGMIFFAIGFRCWLVWSGAHPIAVHLLTPCRIDALAVGAFIAASVRTPGGLDALLRLGRPLALACFALVTAAFAYRFFSNTGRTGEEGFASANLPEIQTIGLTLIAIAFGGLLVHVVAAATRSQSGPRPFAARFFESAFLRALGKYSYAMYLFHQPVRAVIRDVVIPRSLMDGKVFAANKLWIAHSQILPQIVFTATSIAATFALAWLSWHVFEKRCLALKKYVEYKRD